LSDAQVRRLLDAVPSNTPLGQAVDDEDLFRISLAGTGESGADPRRQAMMPADHAHPQAAAAAGRLGGGSRRVDLSDSIENEWLCAQLIRELAFASRSGKFG
jgi:serine/threonine-protein kinase HipA